MGQLAADQLKWLRRRYLLAARGKAGDRDYGETGFAAKQPSRCLIDRRRAGPEPLRLRRM
jgi:hypothetical protein